jgi:hypothetical protein
MAHPHAKAQTTRDLMMPSDVSKEVVIGSPTPPVRGVPFLPASGSITLDEVLAGIRQAPSQLAFGDHLELRVVAIPATGPSRWAIYAGDLRVREGTTDWATTTASIGPIRLVRCRAGLEAASDESTFWNFARSWIPLIGGAPDTVRPHVSSSINRLASRNEFGESPAWRFELHGLMTGDINIHEPPGPFFGPTHGFFATTLKEVAARWLDRPNLERSDFPHHSLAVVIPDLRGYLGELRLEENNLLVELAALGSYEHLTVAAVFTVNRLARPAQLVRAARTVTLPLPEGDISAVQLFLMTDEGECLDHFEENEHRCTRPERVLQVTDVPAANNQLDEILACGENDAIEFKAFVPVERTEPKSKELLKVVCAFANTRGGQLFIGINDDAEVVGVARALLPHAKAGLAKACREYETRIRRLIREGIHPTVACDCTWESFAGHDVMRIRVEADHRGLRALSENGESYVRRGASCKRAGPAELERLLGHGGPRHPWHHR